MSAPITPLEALEDLVTRLYGSGFTDADGRPLERNPAFKNALEVLEDRVDDEEKSFAPSGR